MEGDRDAIGLGFQMMMWMEQSFPPLLHPPLPSTPATQPGTPVWDL